ncbi:hypothetical protein ACFQE1_05795 [Halobium palmae]|uniref:Uncharacterized protein n=1 Tax=Halobium palmae TaxID=1776492 RepID=A0ABD5RYP8_9EURY
MSIEPSRPAGSGIPVSRIGYDRALRERERDLQYLLWLSPLPSLVGVGLFALTYLRRVGSIRFVGIPLLVFSGTWALAFAVGLADGGLPAGLPFVELLAVSLIAMGSLLTVGSTTPNSRTPAGG